MELVSRHLVKCLCPQCNFLPYWVMALSPDGCGSATFKDVTHNIGRWMDAMLQFDSATGFTIPAVHESASLRNLNWLTDNPDHFLQMPPDFPHCYSDGKCFKLELNLHSLREAIMSLGSLAWRRGSRWAGTSKAAQWKGSLNPSPPDQPRMPTRNHFFFGVVSDTVHHR